MKFWKEKRRAENSARLLNLPWRRPTLAQAIQALPSALQRFTSVFGMGTGGTTAVMPPGKLNFKEHNSLIIAYRYWQLRLCWFVNH